jgi:hypothetical protein
LGVDVLLYMLLLLVPVIGGAFPGAVHFGARRLSDYTPSQLGRVMPVLKRMVGILCCVVALIFGTEIHLRIRYALVDIRKQPPTLALYLLLPLCILLISWYFVQRMDEAAQWD